MAGEFTRSNVDSSGFMDALKQIHRTTGIGMKQIFQWQIVLFIRDAMIHTQSRGSRSYAVQFNKAQKSVNADINRMFTGYQGGKDDMWWDGRKPREGFIETKTRAKGGSVYLVPRNLFGGASESGSMSQWHRAHFESRKQPLRGEKFGNWWVSNQMHVQDEDFQRFKLQKIGAIGKAKAGWMTGLRHFTSRAPSGWLGADKTPDWVNRHSGGFDVAGSVAESWSDSGNIGGYLAAMNEVPHAFGDMRIAMEKRTKDMMKWAPLRLEKILNNLKIKATMNVTVTA